jgi:hypothetical protein
MTADSTWQEDDQMNRGLWTGKNGEGCGELPSVPGLFLPALFDELECQSLDLPVLECYLPLIRDKQDPVIRYGFLAIGCPDAHVVRLQADVGSAHAGPVVRSTPVAIPDPDVPDIVTVIVPVLLQECMAG